MRFLLDPSARLVDDDRVLIGGSPLAIFRLTEAGGRLVRRIAGGEDVIPSPAQATLLDRLTDAGVIHPQPLPGASSATIAVVVPAYLDASSASSGRPGDLGDLGGLGGLGGLALGVERWLLPGVPMIDRAVVDDASPVPLTPPVGWRVIRADRNAGPGAARNRGVASLSPEVEVVLFLDTDTRPLDGSAELLAHFVDPRVGAVAARVITNPGPSRRARYETWRSPLDLGSVPGPIKPATRISYAPAAALAVRRAAFDAVGGFDETLRFGEDVDLLWRLADAGWRCRYEPKASVAHEPRANWRGWWRQRVGYGSSAAPLALRHPGRLAPVRGSGWTAAVWSLVVVGHPVVALGVAAGTTAALVRKLPGLRHPRDEAVRLAGLGHLYGGRMFAAALWRAWWPIGLVVALGSRRARRAMAAAAIIPTLIDWRRDRPPIDPVTAVVVRTADDVAYGVGLWQGMRRTRSLAAITPEFRNWPGKPRP